MLLFLFRRLRFRGVEDVMYGSMPGIIFIDRPSSNDGNEPLGLRSEKDCRNKERSLDRDSLVDNILQAFWSLREE